MLKILEKHVVKGIKDYLEYQKHRLSFNRITTTGKIYGNGKRQRFIPNPDMEGFSDFHILSSGNAAYMEVKAPSGIISSAQLEFLLDKQKHGAKVGVVWSVDEGVKFIRALLEGDLRSVGI